MYGDNIISEHGNLQPMRPTSYLQAKIIQRYM